ncbi:hypothetical protein Theco_4117 (plasmid) [Thermobacillus composti KWC4]|uniref:Uncharacterized protein n=1 Tax=Thermobacillus composti (strain DSM 18247 / JCM 13945 / KWC4) TaxID=717605 RepID=L0EIP6_THECK|nr:hypothetical protein Theco_4117 [Thermobacillus composti KWC4]
MQLPTRKGLQKEKHAVADIRITENTFADFGFKKKFYEVTGLRTLYVVPVKDSIDPWSNWHICEERPRYKADFLYGLDLTIEIIEDHDSYADGYALNKALERACILSITIDGAQAAAI